MVQRRTAGVRDTYVIEAEEDLLVSCLVAF